MRLTGQYSVEKLAERHKDLGILVTSWTASVLFFVATAFAVKASAEVSRGTLLVFYVTGLVTTLGLRTLGGALLRRAMASAQTYSRKVVILEVEGVLTASEIDALADGGRLILARFKVPGHGDSVDMRLGNAVRSLTVFCQQHDVDDIVIAIPWADEAMVDAALAALRVLPLPVYLVPDAVGRRVLRHPFVRFGSLGGAELQRAPLRAIERSLKRVFDVTLASIGLVVLAPLMAIIAVLIKLDTDGPVLFRQTRVGFGGRPFRIYKFRSMRTLDDGAVVRQATRGDPRVTRIGACLRRSSLDEVPQLINVLVGDMSLVGPRPHALAHDSEYGKLIASYAYRHHMKPGITGWAQANGYRGETPTVELMQSRVEHDLWYIANWSLWLDVRTILRTVTALIRSDKAF